MKFQLLLIFTCFLIFSLSAEGTDVVTSSVSFYSEQLQIHYDPGMIIVDKKKKVVCTREKCLKAFYTEMKEGPYETLLDDLLKYREQLALNDWLYCRLVRIAVDKVYSKDKELNRALAWWFLLNESGYDVRMAVSELIHVFLYAPSDQRLMDVPSFSEGGKRYYNLTAKMFNVNTFAAVFNKPKFIANKNGRNMSFSLEKMPLLKSKPATKKITFKYQGVEKEIEVKIDKVIQEIMIDYPRLEEMEYLNSGLSTTLDGTLRPQLETLMNGKSDKECLEILAAFTRTAFQYKWDWDVYDEDRPMFAEQLFQSKYSDHEDRCALYYYLVKKMLDLPMIVITHYNNNMTLGVEIKEKIKRSFDYKGKTFTICDPTHPTSTGEIGRYPNGLTSKTASVLGDYKL